MMKELDLNLSIDEINLILEGLGNLPFNKVYALIAKIQEQAGRQLQSPEAAAATETVSIERDVAMLKDRKHG
ncbi:MAG: hypothetical protein ACU84J_13495 [Gammaproteobacteria bacterium]